MSKLVIT